ncbi:MAG: disulfide bond formation protein DsbB [Halieaceae bacterium]|jgi:disulfide bond formation protein DsbB
MNALLAIRPFFAGIFLLTVLAMAFALYLQHGLALSPCPLCITQRIFVILTGLLALIAALHNPRGWGRRLYALLCVLAAVAGGAVAARHVWLQHLPEDLAPACGPSLAYMLDTLPLSDTFELVMMGDGNCADVVWTLLGFSIPEQTLALFLVLGALSLYQLLRRA